MKKIVQEFETTTPGSREMMPRNRTQWDDLLALEQQLQTAWFSLVFYPVEGDASVKARSNLFHMLKIVDRALGESPGPWFLGGDAPSLLDIHFVTTMERLVASCVYYKGLQVRGKYSNLDKWWKAWENRPNYRASRCDFYTHAMAMPSQNGPGYFTKEAKKTADLICGLDGSWTLPLKSYPWEPIEHDDEIVSRHEAAFALVSNPEAIVRFACRGAGEVGTPSFHAELSDPYAEPNMDYVQPVDVCLRYVATALIYGNVDDVAATASPDLKGQAGNGELRPGWDAYKDGEGRTYYWNDFTGDTTWTAPTQQLDTCIAYLRDRIGVPRDMSHPAAMQLRAHLNWMIDLLQ